MELFKEAADDVNVGLPLRVTDFAAATDSSILKKVQASFIFIGIRNWDVTAYPSQSPVL